MTVIPHVFCLTIVTVLNFTSAKLQTLNLTSSLKDKLAQISSSVSKSEPNFILKKLIETASEIQSKKKKNLTATNIRRSLVNLLTSGALDKEMKRELQGTQPTDTIHTVITVPSFTPQISVPRIVIQNFNPPNAPMLPDAMPKPEVSVHVHLPKPFATPSPMDLAEKTKARDLFMSNSKTELKDIIKNAFLHALMYEDPLRTKYVDGKRKKLPEYSLSMISSPTKRMELNMKIRIRKASIEQKIKKILNAYKLYKEGLGHKLKFLDDVLDRSNQVKRNFITMRYTI